MNNKISSLLNLPIELLCHIISHMDFISIIRFGSCRSILNLIIKKYPLDLLNIDHKYGKRIDSEILNLYPEIKKLKFYRETESKKKSKKKDVPQSCSKMLVLIHPQKDSIETIKKFQVVLKNLEELDLTDGYLWDLESKPLLYNFYNYPNLKKLYVSYTCFMKHLSNVDKSQVNFLEKNKVQIFYDSGSNVCIDCSIDDFMNEVF